MKLLKLGLVSWCFVALVGCGKKNLYGEDEPSPSSLKPREITYLDCLAENPTSADPDLKRRIMAFDAANTAIHFFYVMPSFTHESLMDTSKNHVWRMMKPWTDSNSLRTPNYPSQDRHESFTFDRATLKILSYDTIFKFKSYQCTKLDGQAAMEELRDKHLADEAAYEAAKAKKEAEARQI